MRGGPSLLRLPGGAMTRQSSLSSGPTLHIGGPAASGVALPSPGVENNEQDVGAASVFFGSNGASGAVFFIGGKKVVKRANGSLLSRSAASSGNSWYSFVVGSMGSLGNGVGFDVFSPVSLFEGDLGYKTLSVKPALKIKPFQ